MGSKIIFVVRIMFSFNLLSFLFLFGSLECLGFSVRKKTRRYSGKRKSPDAINLAISTSSSTSFKKIYGENSGSSSKIDNSLDDEANDCEKYHEKSSECYSFVNILNI